MDKKTKITIGVAGGVVVLVGAFAAFGGPIYKQLAGTPDAAPTLAAARSERELASADSVSCWASSTERSRAATGFRLSSGSRRNTVR